MQAKVNAKDLQNALDNISRVVFSGSSILADQLLLNVEDLKIHITYAAFDAAMFITLAAENTVAGEVSCGYEKFYSIVSSMPSGSPISMVSSTQLSMDCGKHKVKLPVLQTVKGAFQRSSSQSWYGAGDMLNRIARAATFARDSVTISDNAIIGTDGLVFACYSFQGIAPLRGGISSDICKKLKKLGAKISDMASDNATYAFKVGDADQFIARKVAEDVRLAPIVEKLQEIAQPIAPLSIEKAKLAELLNIGSKLSEAATVKIDKTSLSLNTDDDGYSGSFDMAGSDTDISFKFNIKDFSAIVEDVQTDKMELRTTSDDTVPIIVNSGVDMYVATKIV